MDSTASPGSRLPEIFSPDVSNVIFLAGAALCVDGLVLMVAAAVLMCKTSKFNKQLQIRERRVDRLTNQYNNSVRTTLSNSSSKTPITGTYDTSLGNTGASTMDHRRPSEQGMEMTSSQQFCQPPQQGSLSTQHMQYMEDEVGDEGWTGEEPAPAACPRSKVTYYASNPVPDPSTTAHYDAFNSLGYHHPSLYNEMVTHAEASQACTCSPTPQPRQAGAGGIQISNNPEYMATSPVPTPRSPPPQFYMDHVPYDCDRMASMTRTQQL